MQSLRSALTGGASRVMLCSATDSGKTEIGMALVKGTLAKGERAAFLCNRFHLVEQPPPAFHKDRHPARDHSGCLYHPDLRKRPNDPADMCMVSRMPRVPPRAAMVRTGRDVASGAWAEGAAHKKNPRHF